MKNNLYRSENVVLKRNAKKNIKKHSQINKLRNTFSHRTAKKITNLQDKEKNEDNYYLTNKEVKIKQTKEKKDMPKIQYNLFYNRNINDYQMFITEYTNTHNGNLSWALKLRANQNKNILTEPSSKKSSSKNKKTTVRLPSTARSTWRRSTTISPSSRRPTTVSRRQSPSPSPRRRIIRSLRPVVHPLVRMLARIRLLPRRPLHFPRTRTPTRRS